MINTIWAVVLEDKLAPLEEIEVPEGTRAPLTLLPEKEADFWLAASDSSLSAVWDNAEDDVYAELLENEVRARALPVL